MVRKKGTTYLAPSPVCLKVLVLVFLGPAGISWPKPSRDQEYQVDGLTPSYLVFWWTGQRPVHGLVTALPWHHHSLHSLQRYSMKVVLSSTLQSPFIQFPRHWPCTSLPAATQVLPDLCKPGDPRGDSPGPPHRPQHRHLQTGHHLISSIIIIIIIRRNFPTINIQTFNVDNLCCMFGCVISQYSLDM